MIGLILIAIGILVSGGSFLSAIYNMFTGMEKTSLILKAIPLIYSRDT
jgi:hypothetical protein